MHFWHTRTSTKTHTQHKRSQQSCRTSSVLLQQPWESIYKLQGKLCMEMEMFAVRTVLKCLVLFDITRSTLDDSQRQCSTSTMLCSDVRLRRVVFCLILARLSKICICNCINLCIFAFIAFLSVCQFSQEGPSKPLCLCLCTRPFGSLMFRWIGYHQQSAAFNEGDRGKINIAPLKMISSHAFIASHFYPFIAW